MSMETFAKKMKGQSAMEYLMTYGWAILIVIIVAAVLFALGVFNPATYTTTSATGFPGFNVPSGGFQLSSGGILTMQITNGVGATIDIGESMTKIGSEHRNTSAIIGRLAPGETKTITYNAVSAKTSGSSYSASVNITYRNINTGLSGFISSGTLTGAVS